MVSENRSERRVWPFLSPRQVVEIGRIWPDLTTIAMVSPHAPEAERLGLYALSLALTAEAAGLEIDTRALKDLHPVLRHAPAGPHTVIDVSNRGSPGGAIVQATVAMHRVWGWAAERLDAHVQAESVHDARGSAPPKPRTPFLPMTDDHAAILYELKQRRTLFKVQDLATRVNRSPKHVGALCAELTAFGYAHQPRGRRQGYQITAAGASALS